MVRAKKPVEAPVVKDNELLCQKCQTPVAKKMITSHLYSKHMQMKALGCRHCDHKLGFSETQMEKHITSSHPNVTDVKAAYTNRKNEPSFASYATLLREEYFGQKPSSTNGKPKAPSAIPNKTATETPTTTSDTGDSQSRKRKAPAVATTPSNEQTCKQCHELVGEKSISSHLYSRHMAEKALSCNYCPFKLGYSVAQMKKHVEETHPGVDIKYAYNNRRNEPAFVEYAAKLRRELFAEATSAEDAKRAHISPPAATSDFAFVIDKIESANKSDIVPEE